MHADSQARHTIEVGTICADVDGTVLHTDLLYESFLVAFKKCPLIVFLAPLWLLRGRSFLKARLAQYSQNLAVHLLPLNEEVVNYLKGEALKGRSIVLASASDSTLVGRLAERLGFVTSIIGSSESHNCKGARKVEAIKEHLKDAAWEYIGDARADFAVWRHAARVGCVATNARFARQVSVAFPGAMIFQRPGVGASTIARALRVHQWLKNALVFLPVFLAHHWFHPDEVLRTVMAAVAFSLCASGVYILNDLLDLEADRQHPRKRNRPCASGQLPIVVALAFVPALFISAFGVGFMVGQQFLMILGIYLMLTTAYSFRLKALALVDIILLAILYTIRIVGGGVAAGVAVSQWLLGLSMFLFLSLACVKRFSELLVLQQRNENRTWGRGYSVGDLEQVASFGSASGYISVLVLALYVSSNEVAQLYSDPRIIWLGCPLLLYWISRIWLLARRGLVHDDPLVFAMRDKVTYILGALGLIVFLSAKFSS